MALKQITLRSWLTKSETKKEFFCPPGLEVTNEELAAELTARLQANRLPAEVELCEIDWDDTGTKQTRAMVRYVGPDAKVDVVRFLVGVDQMGNFAYVEQKNILRPPDLPVVPRERKTNPWEVGNMGCIILALFIVPIFLYFIKQSEVDAWNAEADREKKEWEEAWENWRKQTVEVAYLAKTDDVFGRFAMALTSTVDDVLQRLFIDQQAELRRQAETQQTQEEIEKELQKRRAEAFK